MSALTIKNLSAGYGKNTVISDINLETGSGKLIALIGPNGSGKSTLIKTMAGLLPKRSGEIWAGDTPLDFLEAKDRARHIAYLSQSRMAMPDMSVMEILELGRAPYRGRLGKISSAGRSVIERAIETCALEAFTSRQYGALSGGEQARVLLGRVLAVDAPIILVDEPIAALDPYFQLATLNILKREAEAGKTVIAAMHDLSLAAKFGDQVWIMSKGQLACNAPPEKAFTAEIIDRIFKVDWASYFG